MIRKPQEDCCCHCPKIQAQKLLHELHSAGIDVAVIIGEVVEGAVGITIQ